MTQICYKATLIFLRQQRDILHLNVFPAAFQHTFSGGFSPVQHTTLSVFHLYVHPPFHSSWYLLLTQIPPHPNPSTAESKFPTAARSAECCCLLCTKKFAEAVSCPQTSAPWSGAREERQGLDVRACCRAGLHQNASRMDLYGSACTCKGTIIQISALYPCEFFISST